MLVVRTIEDTTNPIGKFVCSKQCIGLYNFSLAVHPLRLDGVQPRALLGQKTANDPNPFAALFDPSVVFAEPSPHLFGDVPTGIVPDEKKDLLAKSFELLATPLKKPGGYGTHRPAVDEPQPRLPIEFGHIEPVAGYSLRLGIVFFDRPLDEAPGLGVLAPGVKGGQGLPAPPALVLETGGPLRIGGRDLHQPVAPPFFLSYRGSGEVIHRLARIHRTERRRESVARIVSPETRSSVSSSSKATSAAISKVHRLELRPNSLGERWSISLRASRPRSLKARMAFLTVCEAHPRLSAIFGGDRPRALARRIWQRRITKASLERSPASSRSRSFSDSSRTKIGGFMEATIAHHTQPSLRMH